MTSPRRLFTAGLVGAVVAAALAFLSEPSALAFWLPPTPTLYVSPDQAAPGDTITVAASGFDVCLDKKHVAYSVRFLWDNTHQLDVASLAYDPNDPTPTLTASATVQVPADAPAGDHLVGLACYDQGIPPKVLLAPSVPVQVSGPPTLQLSPARAGPGRTFTVTGTGFGQCFYAPGQVTSVLLLVGDNRQPLGPATGSGGAFTGTEVVPKDAVDGTYTVVAECYDPRAGNARSGPIARQPLVVAVPASSATASPSPSPSSSSASSSPSSSSATSSRNSPSSHASGSSSQTPGSTHPTVPPVTSSIPLGPSPPAGLKPSAAGWQPIAWVGGTIALPLVLVFLLLVGLQSLHPLRRWRGVHWVKHHVRVVARSLDSPSTKVRGASGMTPSSLSLDPRPDHVGNQTIREVAR
jgi:hypothetical protein